MLPKPQTPCEPKESGDNVEAGLRSGSLGERAAGEGRGGAPNVQDSAMLADHGPRRSSPRTAEAGPCSHCRPSWAGPA